MLIFQNSLKKIGIESCDSKANFIVAKLGDPEVSEALRQRLEDQNILIRRPFREPELCQWTRISSSPPDVQKIVVNTLVDVLNNRKRKNDERL